MRKEQVALAQQPIYAIGLRPQQSQIALLIVQRLLIRQVFVVRQRHNVLEMEKFLNPEGIYIVLRQAPNSAVAPHEK